MCDFLLIHIIDFILFYFILLCFIIYFTAFDFLLLLFIYLFIGAGDQTQILTHAKLALYH
jgi:hypothetical protein